MLFYLGTHMLNHARQFERCFISINRLRRRVSNFAVGDWILDSGAFTELVHFGEYHTSVEDYATLINRWVWCGHLEMAVTQDYMCEPFMLQRTGLTIAEHQRLTIKRYDALKKISAASIMPVLQGYAPTDYVEHIRMYGWRLTDGQRVGVGSLCKRNSAPSQIVAVLEAIKRERPDLRLHGFGLKVTALSDCYITSMLYSADSMAWSFAARRQGHNPNGLSEALTFLSQLHRHIETKGHQLDLIPNTSAST